VLRQKKANRIILEPLRPTDQNKGNAKSRRQQEADEREDSNDEKTKTNRRQQEHNGSTPTPPTSSKLFETTLANASVVSGGNMLVSERESVSVWRKIVSVSSDSIENVRCVL
jgi:sRNA-binding protein